MKKYLIISFMLFVGCTSSPRYEYHGKDAKYKVVFDNKTGKVYYKMYGEKWELDDPLNPKQDSSGYDPERTRRILSTYK